MPRALFSDKEEEVRLLLGEIRNPGNNAAESISLSVVSECNLANFILMNGLALKGKLSQKIHKSFWFPARIVQPCDRVLLYTGKGRNGVITRDDGGQDHCFYWRLSKPVWKSKRRRPVLFSLDSGQVLTSKNEKAPIDSIWNKI